MARPSEYDPRFVAIAAKMCALGGTDRDLAEALEVDERTVQRWRARHEEFAAACTAGKTHADDRVERSLYSRAVGYTFDSEKLFCHEGEVIRAPIIEHVPPDVTACIFWLKNRRPELWRDALAGQQAPDRERIAQLLALVEGRLGELGPPSQRPARESRGPGQAH